jgi:hypothetical protein
MSYFELGLAELPIAAETQQCLVSKCASGVGTRVPLDAENRIATKGSATQRRTLWYGRGVDAHPYCLKRGLAFSSL